MLPGHGGTDLVDIPGEGPGLAVIAEVDTMPSGSR
jgi:hypothetical protein